MGPTTRLRNSTCADNARKHNPSLKARRSPAVGNPATAAQVQKHTQPSEPGAVLSDIRLRLTIALAATAVCSAALRAQRADSDEDAAVVLQRCVGDELDRQIERIGSLLAGGAS